MTLLSQLPCRVNISNTCIAMQAIDRPLFKDFWERFRECLTLLRDKHQRTVYRSAPPQPCLSLPLTSLLPHLCAACHASLSSQWSILHGVCSATYGLSFFFSSVELVWQVNLITCYMDMNDFMPDLTHIVTFDKARVTALSSASHACCSVPYLMPATAQVPCCELVV